MSYYEIEKAIKKALEERCVGEKFLCEKLGIQNGLFNKSMNLKRQIKASELISVCLFLGIDINNFRNTLTRA